VRCPRYGGSFSLKSTELREFLGREGTELWRMEDTSLGVDFTSSVASGNNPEQKEK
jgi:hypothetical protein